MIRAARFIDAARERGFGLYTGVPCSYLTPLINHVIGEGIATRTAPAGQLRYVGAANEGDAVAIAAGAELGGLPSVAMFQNSGLGNAVNPLTSLAWTFRIPVLLIVTWRGEPGGAADEPQHELMGQVTAPMLELMGIPWSLFPLQETEIDATLDRACDFMTTQSRPYAFIMRKGSVADTAPEVKGRAAVARSPGGSNTARARATRKQMLGAVQAAVKPDDVVVATTGYTGRELYSLEDRSSQLYMVGSMGCAISLGLGLALARPDKRVIVVDGDGAALMRLGALTTVGHEAPPNLLHVLLDNGMHESTGGQATVAGTVDFCAIAAASGYAQARSLADPDELRQAVAAPSRGPGFIHVPIAPGIAKGLPRPSVLPSQVAARLRQHLGPRPT